MLIYFKRVSNKWILYKVTCDGRAGASPEWTVPTAPGVCVCVCVYSLLSVCVFTTVCVYLDGSNAENTFHCWLYSA